MSLNRERIIAALPAYDVGEELGKGAAGIVFAGYHKQLQRDVAIKQLPDTLAHDAEARARFVSEARLLARLGHPHIVPVYDFVDQEGLCLLIMEQLTGGTLRDRELEGGMDPPTSCAVLLAACAGLHHAHARGILHRDVKPENLMFSAEGTLKVADFGIAKFLGRASTVLTETGGVLGTPAYISPEQAKGDAVTPATDVYAAGTMLYELLAGRLPFPPQASALALLFKHAHEDPEPLAAAAPGLPSRLSDVVTRAIARDPKARFQSAEEFAGALHDAASEAWGPAWLTPTGVFVSGTRAAPPRPAPAPPGRKSRKRERGRPSLLAGGLGAFVLTAIAIVAVVLGRGDAGSGAVFQDDFSTPASGWTDQTVATDTGQMGYAAGAYRVLVSKSKTVQKSDSELEGAGFRADLLALGSVSVESDVRKVAPVTGFFGVFCRETPDHNSFYAGLVDGAGAWGIYKYELGEIRTVTKGETASLGGGRSHVRLDCLQSGPATTLELSVNGERVARSRDLNGLPPGRVGVMAAALETAGVEARFDNFAVRRRS